MDAETKITPPTFPQRLKAGLGRALRFNLEDLWLIPQQNRNSDPFDHAAGGRLVAASSGAQKNNPIKSGPGSEFNLLSADGKAVAVAALSERLSTTRQGWFKLGESLRAIAPHVKALVIDCSKVPLIGQQGLGVFTDPALKSARVALVGLAPVSTREGSTLNQAGILHANNIADALRLVTSSAA